MKLCPRITNTWTSERRDNRCEICAIADWRHSDSRGEAANPGATGGEAAPGRILETLVFPEVPDGVEREQRGRERHGIHHTKLLLLLHEGGREVDQHLRIHISSSNIDNLLEPVRVNVGGKVICLPHCFFVWRNTDGTLYRGVTLPPMVRSEAKSHGAALGSGGPQRGRHGCCRARRSGYGSGTHSSRLCTP